jgi:hypothetical protein
MEQSGFSFDRKPWGTLRHLKDSLEEYGISKEIVARLRIIVDNLEVPEEDRELKMFDGDCLFGHAKYFNGIEQPLFSFHDASWIKSNVKVEEDGSKKLQLQLRLEWDLPCINMSGDNLTQSLYEFVVRLFDNNRTNHGDAYKLREAARVKLYTDDPEVYGRSIDMTFFEPKNAQAFVDYINTNYKFS